MCTWVFALAHIAVAALTMLLLIPVGSVAVSVWVGRNKGYNNIDDNHSLITEEEQPF
jgi:hypothetical protein